MWSRGQSRVSFGVCPLPSSIGMAFGLSSFFQSSFPSRSKPSAVYLGSEPTRARSRVGKERPAGW